MIYLNSLRQLGVAMLATVVLSGCATSGNPKDPYEGFNRAVFKFNDALDQNALKPAATAYKKVLPTFAQTGISNFFGNLSDVWSAVNNFAQLKGQDGMNDVMRVTFNSTWGLFGLLDIASEAGLPKHNEDFGQTLGTWGVPAGPYVMLPLFGPSTLRDTVALPVDLTGYPLRYKKPVYLRNIGIATRFVQVRADLLDASNLMEQAALDRYEFVRDGYLQQRESKIHDGDVPPPEHKADDSDTDLPSSPATSPKN